MSTYKNITIMIDRLKYKSIATRSCAGAVTNRNIPNKYNKIKEIYDKQDEMWKKLKFLEMLQWGLTNVKKD